MHKVSRLFKKSTVFALVFLFVFSNSSLSFVVKAATEEESQATQTETALENSVMSEHGSEGLLLEDPPYAEPYYGDERKPYESKLLLENEWAEKGDTVIFVVGEPITRVGVSNEIVIHTVGDVI